MRQSKPEYNKDAKANMVVFFGIIFLLAVLSGCSSAPKKPAEVFTDRNIATNQLNLANQTANRGRYEEALHLLAEARRIAVSTDDQQLRLKTSMARGNILFALGRHDEAFQELENSAAEGDASSEKVLASLARIYIIRARLRQQEEGIKNDDAIKELIVQLNREMSGVGSDSIATAAGYVTLGMAAKLNGRFSEAENVVKKALEIHEKGRFLEDSAYDWFLIASIRSMAGYYDLSIEALKRAISFDRRAENGFGLASSWQAMGDVYKKAGNNNESSLAYRRAAEIYRTIGFDERAEKLE